MITVDNEITHEIYRSGYCQDNQTHIRDWNVLPMYFLDDMKNDYQDADICIGRDDVGFVIHGSNTADVECTLPEIVQENPNIDIKKLEWERKQVKTFITGVKADDCAKTIENDRMVRVVVFCRYRLLVRWVQRMCLSLDTTCIQKT